MIDTKVDLSKKTFLLRDLRLEFGADYNFRVGGDGSVVWDYDKVDTGETQGIDYFIVGWNRAMERR